VTRLYQKPSLVNTFVNHISLPSCLSSKYPHGSCLPPTATPNTPFNTGTGSDATSSSHNTLYGRFRVDDCDGCTRPFLPASLQAFQANISTRGHPWGFREAIKLCLPHRRGRGGKRLPYIPLEIRFRGGEHQSILLRELFFRRVGVLHAR
jgi:hypothetical protein